MEKENERERCYEDCIISYDGTIMLDAIFIYSEIQWYDLTVKYIRIRI